MTYIRATVRLDAGSLDQDEVIALALRRYAKREAATRARHERERRQPMTPDEKHEWLTASQAAHVVGMTPTGIYKRAQRGAIPYTDHRGQHWFRKDHMEVMGTHARGLQSPSRSRCSQ